MPRVRSHNEPDGPLPTAFSVYHAIRETPVLRISKPSNFVYCEIRTGPEAIANIVARYMGHSVDRPFYTRRQAKPLVSHGEFAECFLTSRGLNFTKAPTVNIATPYQLVTRFPQAGEESIYASRAHSVVTTLALRKSFAEAMHSIACESPNAVYILSAFKAVENLFLMMVESDTIPLATAERTYRKFDGLRNRFEHPTTPKGEAFTSYTLAYRMLAKACGLAITDVPQRSAVNN